MAGAFISITSDADMWAARMREFLHDCVTSAPSEECERVREAALLLACEPRLGAHRGDAAAVEAMLACGAAESAVFALLGPDTAFMLSRGEGNSCLATVVLGDGSEELISEGATLALALLAAHVSVLLAGHESRVEIAATPPARRSARLH